MGLIYSCPSIDELRLNHRENIPYMKGLIRGKFSVIFNKFHIHH
jgi:hypothetical protein